ncbi:1-(5-phosphoribosyl)-5-[(5-phosphoribosylamino)methylideneamino]imidazole-4-carboxamide isomerase [Iamia sp. SCSIO 61187]|uniref:1-(5-phosphoribosyl)-5-[(5- phosphoribosylamino)methylideneamino]imidazole-4- carboxamide isomerase n=1 Tax=Iamia sp. SCSIO 61187 TaxID=2722752 RepID=UPI001C62FCCD|nr:1-(5-phosphoribosyl)-5-[(5-phosphoribosylamino)methylideneamino]imidazole-4-carboxamide isomerase [Iamia sp. SCSIO 61187]QYG93358.1 1-(5-phosphoribosyl)-5-[(5-phosphoribosylamino)methylideneamino]imidazole-4-carboxamide isomerase [Iamia sp. SCSIO 61187]
MDLFPAIDLRGGRCVRLTQGDFARETVYGDDPVAQARVFADAGSPWIHVVDLDGARTGDGANREVIKAVAASTLTPVQTGGGIRSDADVDELLDAGVARVVLGTAALEDPAWARAVAARHPGRVVLGLDARGDEVAVRGWAEGSGRKLLDVAREMDDAGFVAYVVTQIEVDGVGTGPDVETYRLLLQECETDIVASGGVGSAAHLRDLVALEEGIRVLAGAVVGKALYDGSLSIDDALAAAGSA